jgi:hypothetical protein
MGQHSARTTTAIRRHACPNYTVLGFLMARRERTDDFSACSSDADACSVTQQASASRICRPRNVRIAVPGCRASTARLRHSPGSCRLPNARPELAQTSHAEADACHATLSMSMRNVVGGRASPAAARRMRFGRTRRRATSAPSIWNWTAASAGSHAVRRAVVSADHDVDRSDNDRSGTILVEAPADVSVRTARADQSRCANERFTVDFDLCERRCGQRPNGHIEDRPPGWRHDQHRVAAERHGSSRRREHRVHTHARSAPALRRAVGIATASARRNAALHAASRAILRYNNCQRYAELVVAVSGAPRCAIPPPAPAGERGGAVRLLRPAAASALAPLPSRPRRGA